MTVLPADILILIAEISAAFIGFSMVIGLLRLDGPGAVERVNAMRAVAELALIAGAGALLALLLSVFGVSDSTLWRISSGGTLVLWLALHSAAWRRLRSGGIRPIDSGTLRIAFTLAVAGMLVLATNVLVPTAIAGALYCSALSVALMDSAAVFVFQTFAERNTKLGDDDR